MCSRGPSKVTLLLFEKSSEGLSVVVDVGNKLLDGSVTSTRLEVNSMHLFLLLGELLCQIFTKLSHLFHSNDF